MIAIAHFSRRIPDVSISDEGTLVLFRPLNDAMTTWLKEHTDGEWWCGALVCTHSCAPELVEGLQAAGFTITS
jgi:hypothetical protein